jgi:hypothetical protein
MLDLDSIRERAAARAGAATPANPANWLIEGDGGADATPANPAKRLIEAGAISQLATLATGESEPQPPEPPPLRDVDARVTCQRCAHYRPHRCGNHRAAQLLTAEVGPELAALPQHCPGFRTRGDDA